MQTSCMIGSTLLYSSSGIMSLKLCPIGLWVCHEEGSNDWRYVFIYRIRRLEQSRMTTPTEIRSRMCSSSAGCTEFIDIEFPGTIFELNTEVESEDDRLS